MSKLIFRETFTTYGTAAWEIDTPEGWENWDEEQQKQWVCNKRDELVTKPYIIEPDNDGWEWYHHEVVQEDEDGTVTEIIDDF